MFRRNKQQMPTDAELAQQLQQQSDFQFAEHKRTGDPLTEECARSNAIAAGMLRRGLKPGKDEVPADLARQYDWQGIKDSVARRVR